MRIALIGTCVPDYISHQTTNRALEHAAAALGVAVNYDWWPTKELGRREIPKLLAQYDGVVGPPIAPHTDLEAALAAIQFARESGTPFLGTCGGFQHCVLEYGRNVLGVAGAFHQEYRPDVAGAFVSRIACWGPFASGEGARTMHVRFERGSKLAAIYACDTAEEGAFCNFELSPLFQPHFSGGSMKICAFDRNGEARAVEIPEHPFFIATLFIPQLKTAMNRPSALFVEFLRFCAVTRNR